MQRLKPFAFLALTFQMSTVALTMSTAAPVEASDDLFSEVAVESVFSSSKSESKARTASATSESGSNRITGAGQLGEMLRTLGFKTERLNGKAVKVTLSHGEWTIPTTLRAAVERGQVDITMGLVTPGKEAKWQADKLLGLLTADAGPAYFAYDAAIGQIQLRQSVSARHLTSDRLSRLVKEMAELAASREANWYETPKAGYSPETTAAMNPTGALPTGTWVAKRTASEAFALQLAASGEFSLVHVKNRRTVRSTGKASRSGASLTLTGNDGKSLAGTISGETSKGFALTLPGGQRLAFVKAG